MSVLFAVLLAADTILIAPLTPRGEAPPGAGVAVAEAILDAVVQANKDSFLTLKQLDAVLRRRDLTLDDPAVPAIAPDLARKLGATDVVAGEIWLVGGRWRIVARRLKVGEAKPVAAAYEEGARASLAVLAESFAARKQHDFAGWRAILEGAVSERRGFLHALGYLAEDRMDQGDEEGALAILDRYLTISPDHPWAMAKKARQLARTGQAEAAIALSEKALALDPGDPELLIETASRYLEAGRDAKAEPLLNQALHATPPRPLAALQIGGLYLRTGKNSLAREALEKCLQLATRDDEARTRGAAHADLARVNARQDRYDEAVAELQRARGEGNNRLPCGEPELSRWKDREQLRQVCVQAEAALAGMDGEELVPVEF